LNIQIKSFSKFTNELKNLWENFEEMSDCYFFQTHEWSTHWFNTIGNISGYEPLVIVVYESDMIKMIMPFAKIKKWGCTSIEWMGGIQTDYKAPLLAPLFDLTEKHFILIWEKVVTVLLNNQVSYCVFNNQPELIGERTNPFFNYFNYYSNEYAHYTKLPNEASTYFVKDERKKIFADSRRQRKRLSELGNLSFMIANNKSVHVELTNTMIIQKQRRFFEMNVQNILVNKQVHKFYTLLRSNFIHCSGLKLNETFIATHWGIVFRNRFYYLMPSFEGGEIGKYSGGRLLLEELLKWAIDKGCHTFDFTIGGEAYKKEWCESQMEIRNSIVPLSLKGKLVYKIILQKKDIINRIIGTKPIIYIYRSIRKLKRVLVNEFKF
jgi:CelD/BcsL family acetyltransferase involved in cellulose biosynthesis